VAPTQTTATQILNPRLQAEKEELAKKFQNADPFPHVGIPDFFSPEFAQKMLDDFPPFEERFKRSERGDKTRKASRTDVRNIGPTYREIDDFIQTSEFLDLISKISGIPDLLYDPDYYGGGTHENLHGQSMYVHVDFNYHPKGWHRRLNLIVYLTPDWKEEWGGTIELHSNPWTPANDRVSKVLPTFNNAVLFETSEHSWHGFVPVNLPEDKQNLSRKSFAIYLYTKERPKEEIAAPHSTKYVPFGMPEAIRPGEVLTKEQHHLLDSRFDQFRGQLKAVYDREQRALEELMRGHRLDLQGYAVQSRAPKGRWPDTWISDDFSTAFRVTRPAKELLLEVAVPPGLEQDQRLEIRAGEWTGTEEFSAGETRVVKVPINLDTNQAIEVAIKASATFSPPNDARKLAYRITSAVLEH
jgi:Rps23 Pro-64 3,4-dihydroxylase Tpa1-like proline 4-hydroxylase